MVTIVQPCVADHTEVRTFRA